MMATIRALPRVVHPGANETFHSWMTRLAARLDLDINTTLRAIGYTDDRTRARASLTGYGLTIAPSRIPAIATATRLPEHRVTDTLLTVFNGGPLTLNIDALATPEGVRIATLTQWVHAGTSTACIQCLVDSGYQWDLNWRLPWVFTCTTHRQSHTNLCPECEQPFQGGRRSDGSLGPRVAASVPLADACTNPAAGTASRGRPTTFCAHPYDAIRTGEPTDERLLLAQHIINARLTRDTRATGAPWWADMRALTSILLAYTDEALVTETLPGLGSETRDALGAHFHNRDTLDNARADLVSDGGDHRTASRKRAFIGTPTDPTILGPIATLALAITQHSRNDAPIADVDVKHLIDALGERLHDRSSSLVYSLANRGATSALRLTFATAIGRNTLVEKTWDLRADGAAIEPRNIPRLWPTRYFESVRHLFTGTLDDYAREYLSLAAVKTITGGSWDQAAEALGWPDPRRGHKVANTNITRLNATGNLTTIEDHVVAVVRELAASDEHVDYRRLEQLVGGRTTLTTEEWSALADEAGVCISGTQNRRRCSAAWAWHTIALAPLKQWPGFHDDPKRHITRDIYTGPFLKIALPDIEPALFRFWTESLASGPIASAR